VPDLDAATALYQFIPYIQVPDLEAATALCQFIPYI